MNSDVDAIDVHAHEYHETNIGIMTENKRRVYQTVIHSIDNDEGASFLLDAPAGSGEKFTCN